MSDTCRVDDELPVPEDNWSRGSQESFVHQPLELARGSGFAASSEWSSPNRPVFRDSG